MLQRVTSAVPVFSSTASAQDFVLGKFSLDAKRRWKGLQGVLLPDTSVKVHRIGPHLLGISHLPFGKNPLYTPVLMRDRFSFLPATPSSISLDLFLERINSCCQNQVPYLWGGNLPQGDDSLLRAIPRFSRLTEEEENICALKGVDCSGLLHWASSQITARYSADIIRQGVAVPISSCSSQEIVARLQKGMILGGSHHVLVVTEKGIVESRPLQGVIVTDPLERIERLMMKARPLDTFSEGGFVVRDLRPLFSSKIGNEIGNE